MSSYLCRRNLDKIVSKMEQKKNNINRIHPLRMHFSMQVPTKDRSMCVAPGTIIETDTHTLICTETPLPPHCVDCDATRELCKIMRCMPYDRQDRKYVVFKSICSNNE